ncbi:hypothetical protein ABIC89_002446 [Variovorax boronicumulans]|uniref:hypothetical protein n=1 Tax=Variovorax boronicumulans TaxID=436515 RepID=UPI00339AEC97
MNKIDDYRSLLECYRKGFYTWAEVGGQSFRLFYLSDDRRAFWDALEPDHRERMTEVLMAFDESAEPFAIKADPVQIWREMTDLKAWLLARRRQDY